MTGSSGSLSGSPWQVNNANTGGVPNKRQLSPPCSIRNINGQTVSTLVQINGVFLPSLTSEDCGTNYNAVNGMGLYPPPGSFCDDVGSIQPISGSGSIHIEFDRDWQAKGYCGSGHSPCDDILLHNYTSTGSISLDVQGFVFWDNGSSTSGGHWELHPFTAWKLSSGTTPLSASFTSSPSNPVNGSSVAFTASATGGTSPYTFTWNFGDSSTGSGSTTTHSYSTPGSYSVSLTVKDSTTPTPNTQTVTKIVTVSSSVFGTSISGPSSGLTGSSLTFTATGSGGTSPYSFSWASTGGSPATGTGSSFTTTYNVQGSYTVSLTGTDANAKTATASRLVSISTPSSSQYTLAFQGFDWDGGGEHTLTMNGRTLASLPTSDTPANANIYVAFTVNATGFVVQGANTLLFAHANWDCSVIDSVKNLQLSAGTTVVYNNATILPLSCAQSITYKFNIGASPASTTTSVTCAPTSVVVNQASKCTVTVRDTSSNPTTPTGQVTLSETGVAGSFTGSPCSLVANSTGTANCSSNFLDSTATGTASISANYAGDSAHSGGSSASPAVITVFLRTTSTSITCSPNSVTTGQVSNCTAIVSDTSVNGTKIAPTGTVALTTNSTGTFSGSCVLSGTNSSSTCSVGYTTSTVGHHLVTAVYSGDSRHSGSAPATFTITVGPFVPDSTSTILSCPTSGTVGIGFMCAATVTDTASSGATAPTGTVTFTPGGNCTPTSLTSSSAGCSVSITPNAVGSLNVTAIYNGDATHSTSSGSFSVIVNPRSASTTVSCPPSDTIGVTVSCVAIVADTSGGSGSTPTGIITWSHSGNGTLSSTSCTLVSGSCSVSYTPFLVGSHTLTAVYGGDAAHATSTGRATITVTVPLHPTITTVSCISISIVINQATTCTANVTDTSATSPTSPTGTISFSSSGTGSFGGLPCTLAATSATSAGCSVTYTPTSGAGTHSISLVYTGDSTHASSSSTIVLTVGLRSTTTTLSCPGSGTVGVGLACSATVVDTSPGTPITPSGSLSFAPGGVCVLSNGSCTVSVTSATPGPLSVLATYGGDATHSGSSGSSPVSVSSRTTLTSVTCASTGIVGSSVTCVATVVDTSGGTASFPTGNVTWSHNLNGTLSVATCVLVSGSCSVSYTPLVVGSHNVMVAYGGDAIHLSSTGGTSIAVAPPPDPTITVVSCTSVSILINQATTCTARVTDTAFIGPKSPTGTVTFSTSGTGSFTGLPCTLTTLSNSSASCSVSYTPTAGAGTQALGAMYGGDSTHAISSGTIVLTVGLRSTATTLNCPSSGTIGVTITCSASVADTSTGTSSTPSGSLSFIPGGSCVLSNGSCSVSFSPTVAGPLSVSVTYSGDTIHSTSSSVTNVAVAARTTSTTIACSPNPVANNTLASCIVTVSDSSPGTLSTPTGTVGFVSNATGTFSSSSCVLGSTSTVGMSRCLVSYAPGVMGNHVITGTYAGDPSHTGSTGSVGETVVPQPPQQPYALVISGDGRVFRYQNATFTLIGQPVTTALRQEAWKPDGSYALIVGDSGVLLKYDGTQLTTVATGTTTNLYAVAWKQDGSYALIAGSGGIVFRYNGTLTRVQNPFSSSIRSISWNPSSNQALMVGASGAILIYQASTGQITSISSGTSQYLYSSAWNPNGQYALVAGTGGVILRLNGTTVQFLNTTGLYSPSSTIRAISWSPDGSFALLVGDSGVVLTYNGLALARVASPASSNLYSISWLGNTAYMAGGSSPCLTYATGVLSILNNTTGASLRGWAWKPN